MIESLEIHHIRLLDALYSCQTLSAVAERLNISQQAGSLKLKKVREILDDPLFVREGHGMVATPYARQIQPYIEKVLSSVNDIPSSKNGNLNHLDRTIVISATDYAQQILLDKLIKLLHQQAPKLKVIVSNIEVSSLTKKMSQGEIYLALTSFGYVPDGLMTESILVENYRCVSSNKALQTDKTLTIEALAKYDFVVTNPANHHLKGSADIWFEQQGVHRNVRVSAPTFFMTKTFIRDSDLVGFLPSRLLPCDGLFDIPLTKYPPGYELVAAYHPSIKDDILLGWLLKQAQNLVSQK